MKYIFTFLFAFLTAACSLVPQFQRPDAPMPAQWKNGELATATDLTDWWQRFNSPKLLALQKQALLANPDLSMALSRIEQARADQTIATASLFPAADLSARTSRTRGSVAGGAKVRDSSARAGIDIAYELDLFGGNRAAALAADADLQGSIFNRRALALVVTADVATTYMSALSLQERIRVAEETREILRKTLDIIQARFDAGAISALTLEQQKMEVANTEATIAALRNSLSAAQNALAVLLGQPPQTFAAPGGQLHRLNVPRINPGQPSLLLERRPDILEAESALLAANANIGVARAALYPSVNIGLAPSIAASPLHSPAVRALDLAAGLSMPLFNAGSLSASVDKARAREKELAENYRKTILVSFREVEDALAAVRATDRRKQLYSDAVQSATKAYSIAEDLFKAGATDYTALLEAQRSLLAAKDNLIVANYDQLVAAVTLYKALGGGWKEI